MIHTNDIIYLDIYICVCIIWKQEMFTGFVFQINPLKMQDKVNIKWSFRKWCELIFDWHILGVALLFNIFELIIMVINSKKIVIGHELNQVVKCEGSREQKRKHTYMVMMMRCEILRQQKIEMVKMTEWKRTLKDMKWKEIMAQMKKEKRKSKRSLWMLEVWSRHLKWWKIPI